MRSFLGFPFLGVFWGKWFWVVVEFCLFCVYVRLLLPPGDGRVAYYRFGNQDAVPFE